MEEKEADAFISRLWDFVGRGQRAQKAVDETIAVLAPETKPIEAPQAKPRMLKRKVKESRRCRLN